MQNSETVDLVVNNELQDVTPRTLDWWWGYIDTRALQVVAPKGS